LEKTKRCPYCDEEIRANAIKCKHCGSMLTDSGAPSGDITPETKIKLALANKYEIIEEIGRGGMASVYKAKQKSLNRTVALKVIHQNLIHDKEFLERFHREAQVSAALNHRNLVTIYDEGADKGVHYMAMEYLDGDDLHRLIRNRGKLKIEETIKIITAISEALDFAHNKGLIHRDVKSSNIIVTREGRAVLTDFGIAHAATGTKLTQTGTVFGTPEYMSPEQAEGKEVDSRSDLYSLGIVMYECLTGKVPFKGDNPITTIYKIINEHLILPQKINPNVPEWLSSISSKILNRELSERYQKGIDISKALRNRKRAKETHQESKVRPDDGKTRKVKLDEKIIEPVKKQPKQKVRTKKKQRAINFGLVSAIIILLTVLGFLLNERGIFNFGSQKTDGCNLDNLSDIEKRRIEVFIEQGDELYVLGNLITPAGNNAFHKFNEVLDICPENVYAEKQLSLISDDLHLEIQQDRQTGNVNSAVTKVNQALLFYPYENRFKEIRSQLQIELLENTAEEYYILNKDSSYNICNTILEIDPGNDIATELLAEIKDWYITEGDQYLDSRQWQSAKTNYEKVISLFGAIDYVQNRIGECNNQIRIASRVSIPNLIGMSLSSARSLLQRTGLLVGTISNIVSSAENRNKVINQNPRTGSVSRGTRINLIVGE